MRKFFYVLAALSILSSGCSVGKKEQPVKEQESAYRAYDFSFKTVNGKVMKLSDFKGKVVLVQFFGTFCPPCRAEMPFLEEVSKKYRGKVVVIGLSVDYMGEDPSLLKEFVEKMGVSYPVGVSDEKTWNNYAGRITQNDGIPQTYIIDRSGNVRYYEVGFTPQYESLFLSAIEKLLKE